ncbi:MAG: hypothetical protein OCC45_04615 [Desulfotalea sp.]
MNRLAYLLAGMAIGALGMKVAKDAKEGNCAPGLKAVVQGGHDIVEKVMGAAETLKEDVEDYIAEAKFAHEEKLAEQKDSQDIADTESVESPEETTVESVKDIVEKDESVKAKIAKHTTDK